MGFRFWRWEIVFGGSLQKSRFVTEKTLTDAIKAARKVQRATGLYESTEVVRANKYDEDAGKWISVPAEALRCTLG